MLAMGFSRTFFCASVLCGWHQYLRAKNIFRPRVMHMDQRTLLKTRRDSTGGGAAHVILPANLQRTTTGCGDGAPSQLPGAPGTGRHFWNTRLFDGFN
jgi:hypothetical protein